jgi:hypothetical protein
MYKKWKIDMVKLQDCRPKKAWDVHRIPNVGGKSRIGRSGARSQFSIGSPGFAPPAWKPWPGNPLCEPRRSNKNRISRLIPKGHHLNEEIPFPVRVNPEMKFRRRTYPKKRLCDLSGDGRWKSRKKRNEPRLSPWPVPPLWLLSTRGPPVSHRGRSARRFRLACRSGTFRSSRRSRPSLL